MPPNRPRAAHAPVTAFSATEPMPEPPFARLVRTHQAMVWRYLRFLGCDHATASDLTQDTFLAVHGKDVGRFGDDGARAYLRRTAKNAFLRRLEREARAPQVDLEIAESAFEWFRGDADGEHTLAALRQCLRDLSDQARTALELRFGERCDRKAIAARLGIGEEGAKSILQRSYSRLRVCIERRLRDEPA